MTQLAALVASPIVLSWSTLLYGPLHFVIYDMLCPVIYLLILAVGVELAIPGGTPVRALVRRHGAVSPVKIRLANDPATRVYSVVALLLALAIWSTIVTFWLSGFFRNLPAPSLSARTASTNSTLIFIVTFVVGLIAGDLWFTGLRSTQTARASLGVLTASMALSATALFFYAVEVPTQDILLVTALGIFVGELGVAARHPSLFHEGLFDVLRSPLESDEEAAAETDDDTGEGGIVDGNLASTGGWMTSQTRAIRERLATQKLLGVGVAPSEQAHAPADAAPQPENKPTRTP
jgi:hypothetical protein